MKDLQECRFSSSSEVSFVNESISADKIVERSSREGYDAGQSRKFNLWCVLMMARPA